jgi:hypothetical protein
MNLNVNWNQSANYEAVGWSFGLFGRLTPELIWLICKSDDTTLEHPDMLQCLYVCRLSCYCNPSNERVDRNMYLQMSDLADVMDAENAIVEVQWGVWGANPDVI